MPRHVGGVERVPTRSRERSATARSTLCCLLAGLGIAAGPIRGQEAGWKAGVAKEIITPEKGVWLTGYGTKRPPDGKLHDFDNLPLGTTGTAS